MKKKFDLEQLMDDWIIPLAILALVIWAVILLSGGGKPKAQETATPAPTEEPVIVQNYGNLQLFWKDA